MYQNQSILVSIIIPSWNTGKYIYKAIRSALEQTIQEIEIIVVDDCSSDNSIEIIQQIQDDRLKLLINDNNLGVSATRNLAIKEAQGKWIAVLDADDWYSPNRLERLIQIATENNGDIVADNLYLIDQEQDLPWGTLLGQNQGSIQKISAAEFVASDIPSKKGLYLGFTKPIFRRDFLVDNQIQYREQLKVTQDFWFVMDCFAHGASYYLVFEPYYYYLSRPGSGIYSDKIERLNHECETIASFYLYQDYLSQNSDVLVAIQEKARQTLLLLQYYNFVEPLKKSDWRKCLTAINFDGKFWIFTVHALLKSLQNRFSSLFSEQEEDYLKFLFKKN